MDTHDEDPEICKFLIEPKRIDVVRPDREFRMRENVDKQSNRHWSSHHTPHKDAAGHQKQLSNSRQSSRNTSRATAYSATNFAPITGNAPSGKGGKKKRATPGPKSPLMGGLEGGISRKQCASPGAAFRFGLGPSVMLRQSFPPDSSTSRGTVGSLFAKRNANLSDNRRMEGRAQRIGVGFSGTNSSDDVRSNFNGSAKPMGSNISSNSTLRSNESKRPYGARENEKNRPASIVENHRYSNETHGQRKGTPVRGRAANDPMILFASNRSSKIKLVDTPPAMMAKDRLVDSPHTKEILKDFYRRLRTKAKQSVDSAREFAESSLHSLPSKARWRVYKELADIARRQHRYEEARQMFARVNALQPFAAIGWIEHAKMVEDHGDDATCAALLREGLKHCRFSETLLIQLLKYEERHGNLQNARDIMAGLRNRHVQRTWRVLIEGALIEARAGNTQVARQVFKFVISSAGVRYGPVYLEAARFEERIGEHMNAVRLVQVGLKRVPHYGPLWFAAFRIHERIEASKGGLPLALRLPQTRAALASALQALPPELRWKVHFVAAQMEARVAAAAREAKPAEAHRCIKNSRAAFMHSANACPVNLRWKVRVAAARVELRIANIKEARRLLSRALAEAPLKYRSQVLIEAATLEELCGKEDDARRLLDPSKLICDDPPPQKTSSSKATTASKKKKKRTNGRMDGRWRLAHARAMLEVRRGRLSDGVETVVDALNIESGNGRLWALLLQLGHMMDTSLRRAHLPQNTLESTIGHALSKAPKSGEVWCEGARILLNPTRASFNLIEARRCIDRALRYTPQFGDTFIENLRLVLLEGIQRAGIPPSEWRASNIVRIDTSRVECGCIHADPNYGDLWFHCKLRPYDTAQDILQYAKNLIARDLETHASVYHLAMRRSPSIVTNGTVESLRDLFMTAGAKVAVASIADAPRCFSSAIASLSMRSSVQIAEAFKRKKTSPFDVDPILP
eukprot:g391.t1